MKIAITLIICLVLWGAHIAMAGESSLSFGRFGTISLYQEKLHPANVILFVSGDGGWNQGVVDMARELAGMDALVAGIDIVHYLKELADSSESCSYPAADFENLSHYLQKRLEFPQYVLPVLIGYSSGATLVYATLAQSPQGTFLGAMSLGFCPDLPLVEVPATGSPRNALAVMITGDGGWAGVDQEIGAGLAEAGIGVVGLNALKYFWTARTLESLGADLDRILLHYLKRWKKDQALLIGYSMGADVMPFAVNRLSKIARNQVKGVALLAPGRQAAFEFHLSNWMGGDDSTTYPVQPEVTRIEGPEIICFYGRKETDSLCPLLDAGRVKVMELKGGHHFGGDYEPLIKAIVSLIEW